MRKPNDTIINNIVNEILPIFPKINKPVIYGAMKSARKNMAIYQYKNAEYVGFFHTIDLNYSKHFDLIDVKDSIAHELIHVIQSEMNITVNHGFYFCLWCVKLMNEYNINAASLDCSDEDLNIANKLYDNNLNTFNILIGH